MDPDALAAIASYGFYFAGVLLTALGMEVLRAVIWGLVFYVVLRKTIGK